MEPTFDEACKAFALIGERENWNDPYGACGQCCDASRAFVTWMKAWGWQADAVAMIMESKARILATERESHVVAWVEKEKGGDKIYFDWTRRQYDPDASFPHITTREELITEGWKLDLTPF